MRLPRRFQIIPSWIRSRIRRRAHRVPLNQLVRFLFQADEKTRGFKYVESCVLREGRYEVRILGYPRPIFWPAEESLATLGMLIHEQLAPLDWHYYQIPQTKLRAEDVVVDCGAAEGLFTLIAQPVCRRVFAVEPNPKFVEYLKTIFSDANNVEVLPVLVSNRVGSTSLTDAGIMSAEVDPEAEHAVLCEVTTLDKLFFEKDIPVSYLKADVEGAELKLLQGAQQLIQKNRPRIAITTYHYSKDADELENYLRSIHPGYQFLRKGMAVQGHPMMLHAW